MSEMIYLKLLINSNTTMVLKRKVPIRLNENRYVWKWK